MSEVQCQKSKVGGERSKRGGRQALHTFSRHGPLRRPESFVNAIVSRELRANKGGAKSRYKAGISGHFRYFSGLFGTGREAGIGPGIPCCKRYEGARCPRLEASTDTGSVSLAY